MSTNYNRANRMYNSHALLCSYLQFLLLYIDTPYILKASVYLHIFHWRGARGNIHVHAIYLDIFLLPWELLIAAILQSQIVAVSGQLMINPTNVALHRISHYDNNYHVFIEQQILPILVNTGTIDNDLSFDCENRIYASNTHIQMEFDTL